MNRYIYLAIFPLLLLALPLSAAPTGEQLLKACETAVANNQQGAEAVFCEWYATPCDCEAGRPADAPRVCLPENYDANELSREVLAGLRGAPELRQKHAATAAAIILARHYPCQD